MSFPDKVGKELEEKSQKQKPDMHAVNIRISGNDNIIVPQVLNTILNIQGSLEEVELLVLIYYLFRQRVGGTRFPNRACERALTKGTWRLRDVRALLGAKEIQTQITFEEHHPLIRNLSEYGIFIRTQTQNP